MQGPTKYKLFNLLPLCLLALVVCAVSFVLDAPAEEQEKTITMFVPDLEWPPYIIQDPGGKDEGSLVEVFKVISKSMGYQVIAKQLPDKRGWAMLREGTVDVHIKAKKWVKAPESYLWSDPFLLNEDVLIFRANSTLSFASVDSLIGKSVAAIKGFVYPAMEPFFDSGKILRIDVTSPYTMLDLLALGRVDAALVNRSETQWLFRTRPDLNPERFRMDETACDSAYYRYVFTRDEKWVPFIEEFNKRLEAMKQDGSLETILDQYR